MAVAVGGTRITLSSAGDLSSTGQFRFAQVDADGNGIVPGTAAVQVVGIGQNKPGASGRPWSIQIDGTSKLLIHGSVNEGDRLMTNAVGAGTATTDTGGEYGAIALEDGSSGSYIAVQVHPGGRY